MQRIQVLSDGRLLFYGGRNPILLDEPQADAAGWCTAGPCLRPRPGLDMYGAIRTGELPRAQGVYDRPKWLPEFFVADDLPATVKVALELPGVGVRDPRQPLLPLDDDVRAALTKLLAEA